MTPPPPPLPIINDHDSAEAQERAAVGTTDDEVTEASKRHHRHGRGGTQNGSPSFVDLSPPPPSKKQRVLKELDIATTQQPSLSSSLTGGTTTSTKQKRQRRLLWNETRNEIFLQPDPAQVFEEYEKRDIWYTRRDYENFIAERIRTIEQIRAMGAPSSASSSSSSVDSPSSSLVDHCMRGLEPFQDDATHDSLHSKRNLHKSTVIMEQCRQSMMGVRDPERFRFLVQSQSDLAQYRAVQLAAMDQYEVYPQKQWTLLSGPSSSSQNKVVYTTHASSHSSSSRHHHQQQQQQQSPALQVQLGQMQQQRRKLLRRRFSMTDAATAATVAAATAVAFGSNDNINIHNTGTSSIRPSRSYQSLASLGGDATNEEGEKVPSSSPVFSHAASLSTITDFSPGVIRRLQENNARRLMQIYKPLLDPQNGNESIGPSNGGSDSGGSSSITKHDDLFRFSLRRDSLSMVAASSRSSNRFNDHNAGHNGHGHDHSQQQQQQQQQSLAAAMMASRLPVRRDSLSHVHAFVSRPPPMTTTTMTAVAPSSNLVGSVNNTRAALELKEESIQ